MALGLIAIEVAHRVFSFAFGVGYSFCAVVPCLRLVIRVRHTSTTLLNELRFRVARKSRKKCEFAVYLDLGVDTVNPSVIRARLKWGLKMNY